MPVVQSTSVNVAYQIGLVHSGEIQHLSGYLPDDDGGSVAAVFTSLKPDKKVAKSGLTLSAAVVVPNGSVPKAFDRERVQIHLCLKGCKKGGSSLTLHLAEWAYLSEGEDGKGGPLLGVLAAAKQLAERKPPGLASPLKFEVSTPAKDTRTTGERPGELVAWTAENDIPEILDLLVAAGFKKVAEVGMLDSAGVDALFACGDDAFQIATKCRFKLALNALQAPQQPQAILPPGYVGHEGVADQQQLSGPGFGKAGPLEEFAATARTLLRQVGGSEATGPGLAQPQRIPPRTTSPGFAPTMGLRSGDNMDTVTRSSGGGRLLSDMTSRTTAQPVALKVLSRQAGAIEEEWTSAGTVRFETSVATRTWKKVEAKAMAFALARALDVANESGLDLAEEPWAEVQLRELAALWFADRNPNDTETADFLRESSMASFGVPRGLWLEAREFRKLVRPSAAKHSD